MFYNHLVIINDELNCVVYGLVFGYSLSRIQEVLKMEKSRKKTLMMIPYALMCILSFVTLFFAFLVMLLSKPREIINEYKIDDNEYIKLETNMYHSHTYVIYEKEFGLGIYCYSTISWINIDGNIYHFIESGNAKKIIDLKKYYNLIKNKKIGLCDTKIKEIEENYIYDSETGELKKLTKNK